MTKHKRPEIREAEILAGAAAEIAENGYHALTMESLAARIGLSKGSVYRFFPNKKRVALTLFESVFDSYYTPDTDEVLGWGLSPRDSLVRLFLHEMDLTGNRERELRIWFALLPETLQDEDFRRAKDQGTRRIQSRVLEMLSRLLARESLALTPEGENNFRLFMDVGTMLIEGVTIERLSGTPRTELERRVAWLLERLIDDAIRGVVARTASRTT